MSDKKAIQIEEPINGSSSTAKSFPGFSQRLNYLCDLASIPRLDDGRQAYVSTLLPASKMAPGDWLKKDRPPKTTTLRKLLSLILQRISGEHDNIKIEAWLIYGDVVNQPFDLTPNEALIPLATTLIVSVANEINIPTDVFDLNNVLPMTLEMLTNFKLTTQDLVEPIHRKIIAQYIKSHLRN